MIHKLKPYFSERVWGGEKLKTMFHKKTDIYPLGESWEVSCHPQGLSMLEGTSLSLKEYVENNRSVLGEKFQDVQDFPILIKFIEANDDLSVQVHPSDSYAQQHGMPYGKSEMWYILDKEPGGGLYVGLKKDETKESICQAINENKLLSLLNFYDVKPGECYYIPAGTIHAIGKGVTLIELQQSSDTTYRLYDYDRRDKNGKTRELHVEQGLEVSDTKSYDPENINPQNRKFPYFAYDICEVEEKKTLQFPDQFYTISVLEGTGKIGGMDVQKGDSFFVDSDTFDVIIEDKVKLFIATGVMR